MARRTFHGSRMALPAVGTAVLLALTACSAGSTATTGSSGASQSGGASAAAVTTGTTGTVDQLQSIASMCGTKPVTVGMIDGYGLNSWSKTVRAELEDEAKKCPNIGPVQYVAARGDLQAQNTAINSLKLKGANVIVIIPDAGPGVAALPAMRAAQAAGVQVVAFASAPNGQPGKDYFDYVDWSPEYGGTVWAKWVVKTLGAKGGNVVYLGGPAGSDVSKQSFAGVQKVFADNPQVKLLTPEPVTTNWDPAMEQQAMSGLLAKYPKIDAVISDYGLASQGVIRAFQVANRPMVPLATTDGNNLSCGFAALKASNPGYELVTVSSRTFVVRPALRKGIAEYEGTANTEPSYYNLEAYEDSTSSDPSMSPTKKCLAGLPADATPSAQLTPDQMKTLFSS